MKRLILRSMGMRKTFTLSIIISIAFSVMTLFALGLIFGGVHLGVQNNSDRGGAKVMVVPREAAMDITDTSLLFTGAPAPLYMDDAIVERVGAIEGVIRITPQFFSQTLEESCCSTSGATRLIGVDATTDWTIEPYAHMGLAESLDEDHVIVGNLVAGNPGDSIAILGSFYTIADKLEVSGSQIDNAILLDIDIARSISESNDGLSYLWHKYGEPGTLVSCLLVDIDPAISPHLIINRINAIDGVKAFERAAIVSKAQDQMEAIFFILIIVGIFTLLSTIAQLFARFYTCVWDRKSEFALYRAIGASKGDIRKIIVGELLCLVIVGCIVGLAFGFVFNTILLDMLQQHSPFPFIGLDVVSIAILACGIFLALVALTASSIISPLSQIGKLDPSLAMQQGDID